MELPLEIKMKPTPVPAVEMARTSGDQPTEEDPEAAASGGPSRLFPASRTCPHAHPEEPESRRGGGREGQRQGRQPAAGNRACQEPVPGRPVTRSLELCAHSRLREECDPDGSHRPLQVSRLSLPRECPRAKWFGRSACAQGWDRPHT